MKTNNRLHLIRFLNLNVSYLYNRFHNITSFSNDDANEMRQLKFTYKKKNIKKKLMFISSYFIPLSNQIVDKPELIWHRIGNCWHSWLEEMIFAQTFAIRQMQHNGWMKIKRNISSKHWDFYAITCPGKLFTFFFREN